MSFPLNPTDNQHFTNALGTIYTYDSTRIAWKILTNTGTEGLTGVQGNTGMQGNTGVQGQQGNTGVQGVQGNTGVQGDIGIQGSTGIQGNIGMQGSTGIQGLQGDIGIQGNQGNQGLAGAQGSTGIQGNIGMQGSTGIQGLQGDTGVGVSFTGLTLYPDDVASDQAGFDVWLRTPPTQVEQDDSTSTTAGTDSTISEAYCTSIGDPGISQIPPGNWNFHCWGYTSSSSGTDVLVAKVYKRSGGIDTELFEIVSDPLLSTSAATPTESQTSYFLSSPISLLLTDRLVLQVFGRRTGAGTHTLHLLHSGTVHASHIDTSLVTGTTGQQGATGLQGNTGIQGIQGNTGIQGVTGLQGNTGLQGVTGLQGNTGLFNFGSIIDDGTLSGSVSLNFSSNTLHKFVLGDNITSLSITNPPSISSGQLIITQNNSVAYTVAWPSNVLCSGGISTGSLALNVLSSINLISWFYDSTSYYMSLLPNLVH